MPEGYPPGLEPDIVQELEKNVSATLQHQWLYSVVPITGPSYTYWTMETQHESFPIVAALTGYCRNCGRAFSKIIPVDLRGNYQETPMDVERFGCILP